MAGDRKLRYISVTVCIILHKQEAVMLVPLITYETIASVYGEAFARTWFRPVSVIKRPG